MKRREIMENDIACEDFYCDDESVTMNAIHNSEYTDDDLFTFSEKYEPIFEKYTNKE